MNTEIYDIYQILDRMGISHANSGYRYLLKAIEIGIRTQNNIISITNMYQEIGHEFGKNETCVERAIRYSIMSTGMSSKEFIMAAVDEIYSKHYHQQQTPNYYFAPAVF